MNINEKNEAEEKLTALDLIKEFFGVDELYDTFRRVIGKNKKDKKMFRHFATGMGVAIVWVVKIFEYLYQLGRFSVYGINECYIDITESLLYQVVQLIFIFIMVMTVTAIFLVIALGKGSIMKRVCNSILLMFFEGVVFVVLICIKGNNLLGELIVELRECSVSQIVVMLIALFLLGLIINMLGIVMLIMHMVTDKPQKGKNNTEKIKKNRTQNIKATMVIFVLILMSFISIFFYYLGIFTEHNRTKFKVIKNQVEYNEILDMGNIFQDEENKVAHEYFIVIFENQEVFIVSRLIKDGIKVKIDYNFQKIIEKNEIETYIYPDVYMIKS